MKRPLTIAALLLPLAALAGSVALREAQLAAADEWTIPITGFDPRDAVRGRYIMYRYDQQVTGDVQACRSGDCRLCLPGPAPDGTRLEVRGKDAPACPAEIDWRASDLSLRYVPPVAAGDNVAARAAGLDISGRIYVSEAEAAGLERAVQRAEMSLLARITSDGRVMNRRLVPRPSATPKETDR